MDAPALKQPPVERPRNPGDEALPPAPLLCCSARANTAKSADRRRWTSAPRSEAAAADLARAAVADLARPPAFADPRTPQSALQVCLASALKASEAKPVVRIIDEASLHLGRNESYADMTAEKNLRGVLRSEVDRSVSKDNIIKVDSLNDIKVSKEQCRDSGFEEEEQHRNPFLNIVGDARLSSSLLAPKPQFRYQVSVARWDEEMRLGEIIKMKGSIWTSMGVIRNAGKLYCTIEEILFLVERGALHLLDGKDVVLSLNDIYKKVSEGKSGCSWECFVVYRHLKSLGYIVRRHGLPWALKSEKNCCFDTPMCSNSLFALDDNEKSDRELESDVHITRLFEAMQINALKLEFDVFLPDSKFKKASPGNPNFVLSLISEKPPRRKEVEDLERQCNHVPLKFCNVDHGRVSFYSFDKINLPVLP